MRSKHKFLLIGHSKHTRGSTESEVQLPTRKGEGEGLGLYVHQSGERRTSLRYPIHPLYAFLNIML
jgi:hypothetical protein